MADPDTISDSSEFQRIAKQTSDLEQTVSAYREYMDVQQQLTEAKQMLKESEGKQVALCSSHFCQMHLTALQSQLVCRGLAHLPSTSVRTFLHA